MFVLTYFRGKGRDYFGKRRVRRKKCGRIINCTRKLPHRISNEPEKSDEQLFADPYATYVAIGGQILVAWDPVARRLAGACILAYHAEDECWEMSKLGVSPDYQRHGLAERLVDATIALARKRGAQELYLECAHVFGTALRLYHRKGFVEIPLREDHYQRTDIEMVKDLTKMDI